MMGPAPAHAFSPWSYVTLGRQGKLLMELEWEPGCPLISVLFEYCRINCILVFCPIHLSNIQNCVSLLSNIFERHSFLGKILHIYSGLLHRRNSAGAVWAIIVVFSSDSFLLYSSCSLGNSHSFFTVSFIPRLPYIILEL